jgi:glycosyltransferase involved in cell wall biosynthesis
MTTGRTDITPLVLTYNEAANLERTLARLIWAPRVVVVDSHSTDETVAICAGYPNVEVVQRTFDGHTTQWNFGVAQVRTPWVLSLDADYVLSDELIRELAAWTPAPNVDAYFARFEYRVFGRPLRASLYPPRAVLFRPGATRYVTDGHTQRLSVDGPTGWLTGRIAHDDRKSVDRWFADQLRYSAQEARHLLDTPPAELNRVDRVRRSVVLGPPLVAAYSLFWRGLVFDGWPGFYYVLQRTIAETLLALRVLDGRCRVPPGTSRVVVRDGD